MSDVPSRGELILTRTEEGGKRSGCGWWMARRGRSGGSARHRTALHHADCKSRLGDGPRHPVTTNARPSSSIIPSPCSRCRTSETKSRYPAA